MWSPRLIPTLLTLKCCHKVTKHRKDLGFASEARIEKTIMFCKLEKVGGSILDKADMGKMG